MSQWLPEIRRRLAAAKLDPAREAEIALELEQHLDDRYREMRAEGLDEEDARRVALDELHDAGRMRTELTKVERRAQPVPQLGQPARRSPLGGLLQDVRYALRMLRRNPHFAMLAILTLALGVGATTIVYAIVDNMMLRPMPYDQVDRLVRILEIQSDQPDRRVSASVPNLRDWQARSHSFEAMGAYRGRGLTLLEGDPERVSAAMATDGFFAASGARPALGRGFTPADSVPGAPRVLILSDGAWRRRFGADPSVIGRSIATVDGSYEIVGVLAPVRMFAGAVEFWVPYEMTPAASLRDVRMLWVLGRLREGVTLEQARAEMDAIAAALALEHPANRGWGVALMPLQEWRLAGVRQPLFTFFGAVACILLIACANVAGLLVARSAGRAGEMTIRSALGADRRRIVRQLVTESAVLALIGGAAGAFVAWLTIGALLPLFPVALPAEWISVDLRVLAIAITASGVSGVFFGLAPALALSRAGAVGALKEHGRSSPRWGRRLGSGLIAIEVALSLVLLAGAGLLVRTLMTVYGVDPGIEADRLVALRATPLLPRDASPGRVQEFYRQLVERVAAAPGVQAAAAVDTPPFGGNTLLTQASSDVVATPAVVSPRSATPGYFSTMGMRVVAGRDFDARDTAASGAVVVVNVTTAAKLWPGQSPIGRQLRFNVRDKVSDPLEVIGVVADVRHDGLDSEALAEIYQALPQRSATDLTVVARAADPESLARQFRAMTAGLPERALLRPAQMLQAMIDGTIEQRRNRAILLGILAGLGLLLAAVGVFGLTASAVAQRTKEIGVRIALGADSSRVLRTVVGAQLWPLAAGVLLGIAGSWWATRALRAFLFGVEPGDPATFTAAAVLIALASVVACYVPARRALRVDPVIALRAE